MPTAPSLSVLSRLDVGTLSAWADRPSICTHICTSEIMDTYTDSVIDAADDYGNLSLADAKHLFAEHGNDYWQAHELDGMPLTLNAVKLLDWLGY